MLIERASKKESLWSRMWAREGLVLAVLPALGSAAAIAYEAGYLAWFGIPLEFAEITLLRIVGTTVALSFFIAVVLQFFSFYLKVYAGTQNVAGKIVIRAFMYGALVAMFLFLLPSSSPNRYFFVLVLIVANLALNFLPPLFRDNKPVRYLTALEQQEREDGRRSGQDDRALAPYFALALWALGVVFIIGSFNAGDNSERYVVDGEPDTLFVRRYGDYVIVKKFDPDTQTLKPPFEVRKLAENGALKLQRLKVVLQRESKL